MKSLYNARGSDPFCIINTYRFNIYLQEYGSDNFFDLKA